MQCATQVVRTAADTHGHSKLHANGMAVSALGALGGRQTHHVRLYDDFDSPEKVDGWLEKIDWPHQWSASHLFWGGMICFSYSRHCPRGWLNRVFTWLDANLDEKTGWWRKGVPHADRHQPFGGSVYGPQYRPKMDNSGILETPAPTADAGGDIYGAESGR